MPHHSPFVRSARVGVALLATFGAVLLLPGTAVGAPSGSAATVTSDPAEAAAGWLAAQLVGGDHIEVEIDLNGDGEITDDERFPDYGLTADTIIALAAAGVGGEAISAATDYLEANIEFYVGDADDSTPALDGEYYAGSLAKALLVADVTGRDPGNFGEVDLLGRLLATETPSGRFSDISEFGDFSNNIGQSFAALALSRAAPASLSPAARAFLPGQQCADGEPRDGNVPVVVDADPCAADTASVDSTSFATQAMFATEQTGGAEAGIAFLLGEQDADGRFSDMGMDNSNSTGLGAQALRVGGEDVKADDAAAWLLVYQIDCDAPVDQQGAIGFTTNPDLQPLYDDRATRATAQATPGLVGIGLAEITAEGASPAAPRLDCDSTPTTTPTPSPTPTPTQSPTPTASPTHPTASPTTSHPGLPNTGTAVGPLLGLAAASLVLGGGLVLAGRRRTGDHR